MTNIDLPKRQTERGPGSFLENIRNIRGTLKALIVFAGLTLASVAYAEEARGTGSDDTPACVADTVKNVDGPVKNWIEGDRSKPREVQLQLESNNCTAAQVGINQEELDAALATGFPSPEDTALPHEDNAGDDTEPDPEAGGGDDPPKCLPDDISEALFPQAMDALEGLNEADIDAIYGSDGVLSKVLQNSRVKKAEANKLAKKAGTAARKLFNLDPDARKKAVEAAKAFMKDKACFKEEAGDYTAMNWDMPDEGLKAMFDLLGEAWNSADDAAKAWAQMFYDEAMAYRGSLFGDDGAKKAYAPDIEGLAYLNMAAAYHALKPLPAELEKMVTKAEQKAAKAEQKAAKAEQKAAEAAKQPGKSSVTIAPGAYGTYHHGWHKNGTVNGVSEGAQVEVCSDFDGPVNVCGGAKIGATHLNGNHELADKANDDLTHGVEAGLSAKMPITLMQERLTLGPVAEGGIINKGGYAAGGGAEMKVRLYKRLWLGVRAAYEHLFGVEVDNGSRLGDPDRPPDEASTDGINAGAGLEWKF